MNLLTDAATILPDLVALRRELHSDPEVGLLLPRTQARVLVALEGLPIQVTRGEGASSIVGVLRGSRPGPTVLLRGDMDALPLVEVTGLDYASKNGSMHACGHDLHMAGLVGAARLLASRRDEIAGSVVFMFQPGEEGQYGARIMLDEGLLQASGEKPSAAFAIHVTPGPAGVFATREGTVTAGSNELHITISGAGGHGSQPQSAVDPVPALAEVVTALQSTVTRRFSVFDPVVVTVTQLQAGEAVNVIPEFARLGATVRTLSVDSTDALEALTTTLAHGIARAHGCTADVRFERHYPVSVNDASNTRKALGVLRDLFGESRVMTLPNPAMASEDFSYVLEEVPGTFVFLSASPRRVNPATAANNHSPAVLFDDGVLADQAAALAQLALAHLTGF